MPDGEDDGVREVHFVGVFVYRGRDNGRVDDNGVIGGQRFAARLHAGVLRGKVNPDVFVEDEGDPDLTCGKNKFSHRDRRLEGFETKVSLFPQFYSSKTGKYQTGK